MDDDGDMAEMYLTEKKSRMESASFYGDQSMSGYRSNDGVLSVSAPVTPVSSPPDGRRLEKSLSFARSRQSMRSSESATESIEELEMLLEAYFVVIDSTLNKLTSVFTAVIRSHGLFFLVLSSYYIPRYEWKSLTSFCFFQFQLKEYIDDTEDFINIQLVCVLSFCVLFSKLVKSSHTDPLMQSLNVLLYFPQLDG